MIGASALPGEEASPAPGDDSVATNVFAYGSLMYPEVWGRVVRGAYRGQAATLDGYRRGALRDACYPGAVAHAGTRIAGRVWFDVDPADMARLDAFEGAEYLREEVEVQLPAGSGVGPSTCRAQIYVFLEPGRLCDRDWDAGAFERDHLERFADEHSASPG